MRKQVKDSSYIKLYTWIIRGATTVIIQRTQKDWIIQYDDT